jgi:hypothetical protein
MAPPATDGTPAWQREIQAEVSALRGLPFLRPVPYAAQSRKDFRQYVRRELARELPGAKLASLARTYGQMGLTPPAFDLGAALERSLTTQVAAYYDPRGRFFRVVDGKRDPAQVRARGDEVIAHELMHALQDQHFDLTRYDGGEGNAQGLDDDERAARRFVAEGEATFVMMAWQMSDGPARERRLGPLAVAGLRMSVTMLAAADLVELLLAARQGGGGPGSGEAAAAADPATLAELEALAELPPVVVLPLVEPYFKGALLVSEVWGRGGWAAVDDLYRRPPRSTEQVLHPVEKFLARRDPPVRIRLDPARTPLLAKARLLGSDVLGELGWRIYFRTHETPAAAAGWGGDRYYTFAIGSRVVVLTATRWDSPAEARRFFAGYRRTLARRFPRARLGREDAPLVRVTRPDGGVLEATLRGADVDIVDGAGEQELPALRAALAGATREVGDADAR